MSSGYPISPPTPMVSRRMARTGPRDTVPEMRLRRLLHGKGLRYRVDYPVLARLRRRADIAFPRIRLAVFIDGCFWHGCPIHGTWPKRNGEFWRQKIEANVRRDRDTDERLAQAGWDVIRLWEHEEPEHAAALVAARVALLATGRRETTADIDPSE